MPDTSSALLAEVEDAGFDAEVADAEFEARVAGGQRLVARAAISRA
jgi:hypothetical protein